MARIASLSHSLVSSYFSGQRKCDPSNIFRFTNFTLKRTKIELKLHRCQTVAYFGVEKLQEDIFELHILLKTEIVFDEDIDQIHGFINLTAMTTKRVFILPTIQSIFLHSLG